MQQQMYLGTSGFSYQDWKGLFYPKEVAQKNWLSFYAQHYNTVEINATFYRYFARTVFAHWHDETGEAFRFTLKGPKVITHEKRLIGIEADLNRFFESSQDLSPKLANVLWQFPFSFKVIPDESLRVLTEFLKQLPGTVRHVIEFRHKSWFTEEVYALLNRYHAGFVINDSSRFPAAEAITGGVVYIRFHGPAQLYASSYSREALQVWAEKIKGWLDHYDVYCYFNNDYGGRAIENSSLLRQMLSSPAPVRHSKTDR